MSNNNNRTRKFIIPFFLLIIPLAHGFGEISVLIDFTEIEHDTDLNGTPVNKATLSYADCRYRSYLPGEWSIVPYGSAETRKTISVGQAAVHDESCMRIKGEVDTGSPGFFVYPPFPPDLDTGRIEIVDSEKVIKKEDQYEGRFRFENYGIVHHAGQIQGAEITVRNLKDPVKITVIIEDNQGNRAGIPYDIRFSGDGFITFGWENSLRDLWIDAKDNRYQYIRLVGIQVESLTLTDFLREREYFSKILTAEEVWEMQKQDEKNIRTSSISLDIHSIRLFYGDHYWKPWEPEEKIRIPANLKKLSGEATSYSASR